MKQLPNEVFFEWLEAEIAQGCPVRFRLKGHSMFPFIRSERDEVVLHPCKEMDLRPMDVVLFRYQGKHVLHRILRKDGDWLVLQGDGSYVAKETCRVSDVVGKVQQIIRHSGKVVSVTDRRWRLYSRMWRGLGIFRTPCLRILHWLMD